MANEQKFEYNVFLSYSSKDTFIVEKLSKRLRRYIPPKRTGLNKKKLSVFRDVERLTASANLPEKLKEKLLISEWLALICSPNTASSTWVNDEVKIFSENRTNEYIIFIRYKDELKNCLPPYLHNLSLFPLYIDLTSNSRKKFRTESLRLIAALYKVDFMYLLREDEARRRRIISLVTFSSILFAFLLLSLYLILSVQPTYWKKIEQPEENWPNRPAPMLPVHEIAINKQKPWEVLFFGKNAEWPGNDVPLYSIIPTNTPKGFDSLSAIYLKEKPAVTPIAMIDFTFNNDSEEFIGKGQVKMWGILNDYGKVRYIRSMTYQPVDEENNTKTVELPISLVNEDDNPFNIGRLVEKLVTANFIDNECIINASFSNLINGTKTTLSYSLNSDELLLDGYISKEAFYGDEYIILSNSNDLHPTILGIQLDSVKHDPSFWKKIVSSNTWLTYKGPKVNDVITFIAEQRDKKELAHEVLTSLPDTINLGELEKILTGLDIIWDGDFLHFRLLTTNSEVGITNLLMIHGEQENRHDVPTTTFIDWLIRFSANGTWKPLKLPSDNIKGLWPLDSIGKSALLLSYDKGFFLTHNSGDTWEPANYNENGFTIGKNVKPFVLNDAVYALVDRGETASDQPNPLYRLQTRNGWERWRLGLIEMLQ